MSLSFWEEASYMAQLLKKKKSLLKTRLNKKFETLEQVRRKGVCRICLLVTKKTVDLVLWFSGTNLIFTVSFQNKYDLLK